MHYQFIVVHKMKPYTIKSSNVLPLCMGFTTPLSLFPKLYYKKNKKIKKNKQ